MKHISDKQIRNFLLNALFGSNYKNDYVTAASNRAYRDFNRTIRFYANVSADERAKTKERITSIIKASIEGYVSKGKINKKKFDEFHTATCEAIKEEYKDIADDFSYGQSQKWLNMTIKYLFILDDNPLGLGQVFDYCHIPIDNYIMDEATKSFKLPRPIDEKGHVVPWSKWDDATYIDYQKKLQQTIKGNYNKAPLSWEFDAWLDAAQK